MIEEHGKIDNDVTLDGDFILHGMITGNVIIRNKSTFILHGMCCKNLVIEQDSRSYIHGTICGNIINNGTLEVYGTVLGFINTSETGNTLISPQAKVLNQ
jgi:cytoskeletal protein CcmA (bactofilin family)